MTKELIQQFNKIGRQESKKDPMVITKFFCPWNSWTRFVTEYDEESKEFFWFVNWLEKERWYFSQQELESLDDPFGLRIERDLYFKPTGCLELGIQVYSNEADEIEEKREQLQLDSKFAF